MAYIAFLSFRRDTRKSFTDHLYRALIEAGIHAFRDKEGIRRGENIELELKNAIHESKLSVIVFSKDYAGSRWCLAELAMIMERKRKDGHIVVPVFYDVDPSEVRNQTGRCGEAFAEHERLFKNEMDRVDGWREALQEVASLQDDMMILGERHESSFIQEIVAQIRDKLNLTLPISVHSRLPRLCSFVFLFFLTSCSILVNLFLVSCLVDRGTLTTIFLTLIQLNCTPHSSLISYHLLKRDDVDTLIEQVLENKGKENIVSVSIVCSTKA